MSDSAQGVYLYCIVPSGSLPELEGLTGVDGRARVGSIPSGQVTAITSPVSLEEFGPERLKRNLEDLQWVERAARAHDSVLAAVMAVDAVVPMRLLTIFTDEASLRKMLERERGTLVQALARLRGRAEWSVKVLADRGALERAAQEQGRQLASTSVGSESPGRAYFARKQGERQVRQRARELGEGAARDADTSLRRHATASRLLPAQHPEVSGRSGQMILNGAYLVERAQSQSFAEAFAQLRDRYAAIGLELELSGPWAPYNFVESPDETTGIGDRS